MGAASHSVGRAMSGSLGCIESIIYRLLIRSLSLDEDSPEKCFSEISRKAIVTDRTACCVVAATKTRKYVVLLRCEVGLTAGTPILQID